MKNHPDLFYAKILLFGEYSVLLNSMGLSIPYAHFKGELTFIDEDKYTDRNFARRSNEELKKYFEFLDSNSEFGSIINLRQFNQDIQNGLYFESSIPESYGLGSSGALCAAIYKRYVSNSDLSGDIDDKKILRIKEYLSKLESGFHGRSSGLDPLNSYLKSPLLIHNHDKIEMVQLPGEKFGSESAIFLIDTKQIGNTAPLVQNFLENCKNKEYEKLICETLIPLNNSCITDLIAGRLDSFFNHLTHLSLFQIKYFKSLIPESYLKLWQEGLDSDKYCLKLCGSGGGGFLLGFTKNFCEVKSILQQKNIEPIPVFQKRT